MFKPNDTENKMVDHFASIDTFFADLELEDNQTVEILIRKLGAESIFMRAANKGS